MAKRKEVKVIIPRVFKYGCWWDLERLEKFEAHTSPERLKALAKRAEKQAKEKARIEAWWEARANAEGISLKDKTPDNEEIEVTVKEDPLKLK